MCECVRACVRACVQALHLLIERQTRRGPIDARYHHPQITDGAPDVSASARREQANDHRVISPEKVIKVGFVCVNAHTRARVFVRIWGGGCARVFVRACVRACVYMSLTMRYRGTCTYIHSNTGRHKWKQTRTDKLRHTLLFAYRNTHRVWIHFLLYQQSFDQGQNGKQNKAKQKHPNPIHSYLLVWLRG